MRLAFLLLALAVVCGCDTPPAFPIPTGPAKPIALDVQLPVYVLGRWTVDAFSDTLRAELAKYNITVVDRRSRPAIVALIDLGRWTYRSWQEIDVDLTHDGEATPLGRIRVPDLSMTTLDVAAQSVAKLIARWIWSSRDAQQAPQVDRMTIGSHAEQFSTRRLCQRQLQALSRGPTAAVRGREYDRLDERQDTGLTPHRISSAECSGLADILRSSITLLLASMSSSGERTGGAEPRRRCRSCRPR